MGRAQHSPRLRSLSNSPLLPTEFFATKAGSPAHNEASLLLGCMCRRESGRLATVGSDDGSSFVVDGEGEPAGFVERSGEKGPAADRPLPHRLAVVEFQSDGRCPRRRDGLPSYRPRNTCRGECRRQSRLDQRWRPRRCRSLDDGSSKPRRHARPIFPGEPQLQRRVLRQGITRSVRPTGRYQCTRRLCSGLCECRDSATSAVPARYGSLHHRPRRRCVEHHSIAHQVDLGNRS